MSIQSMTGYGRHKEETGLGILDVEVRSVNHRYTDLNLRIPRDFQSIEDRIKKLISRKITRGRISVAVTVEGRTDARSSLGYDEQVVDDYLRVFRRIKERYGLQGEVDLGLIAGFPDIITRAQPAPDDETVWAGIEPVLARALADCISMREREGRELADVVNGSLDNMKRLIDDVEELAPGRIERVRERLRRAVSEVAAGMNIEDSRLLYEVSLVAERWDITEEIDRSKSHLAQFRAYLEEGGVLGKRLTFLCQELHREANTIAAKANDSEIVQIIVLVKEEIEKIREQLENLE